MFNVIPGTAHQGATLEEAHRDILVSPPMNKRFDKGIQFLSTFAVPFIGS